MYNSIANNLTNTELTTVVHFVVKMLNKYKSKESREVKLADLPVNPGEKLLPICLNLLKEIDIEKLDGKDKEIDQHIQSLFKMLTERLNTEVNQEKSRGKELLDKFKHND